MELLALKNNVNCYLLDGSFYETIKSYVHSRFLMSEAQPKNALVTPPQSWKQMQKINRVCE
jgi:hypothetical protein